MGGVSLLAVFPSLPSFNPAAGSPWAGYADNRVKTGGNVPNVKTLHSLLYPKMCRNCRDGWMLRGRSRETGDCCPSAFFCSPVSVAAVETRPVRRVITRKG